MTFALEMQRILWGSRKAEWKARQNIHIHFAYWRLGSIRDCGIEVLTGRAAALSDRLLDPEVRRQIGRREDEFDDMHGDISTDVQLRLWLCEEFEDLFAELGSKTRETLKFVVFNIAYPLDLDSSGET